MLGAYAAREGIPLCDFPAEGDLSQAQWIDLLNPTDEEKARVQAATGLEVSTEDELSEIETSSRLFYDGTAIYLSMPLVAKMDGMPADVRPIGFILNREKLVTIRFNRSRAFHNFLETQHRKPMESGEPIDIFLSLLEAISDRMSDLLENMRDELDAVSKQIFSDAGAGPKHGRRLDNELQSVLKRLGRAADLMSSIRDSLLGVGRILPYVGQIAATWIDRENRERLKSLRQDITSLSDYDGHLNNKLQFLLDATLGLINNAQNNIIKVLTVVSVVGVPPTLIASIYGMNFKDIPELNWTYGYPYGIAMIVLSAVLPLIWFKVRGWL
ncbi:magnesium transporter CorA family protein [Acidisoma cellulosilytica]|uniref:Magnesium transport protein CorA n=1 Tax=Acidisoma cellulosilyticum TaxID=2802395 RepID=A0A964E2K8_9PROT|nr:magnesium transporter CorA family protein [Acidisoma cellulosilyticum]MCB8879526.1 magnesium transporter CorA family protein [Acidisoma cellulosilyticum]